MLGHLRYDCVANSQKCKEVVDCAACFVTLRDGGYWILIPEFIAYQFQTAQTSPFTSQIMPTPKLIEGDFYFQRRAWP